MVPGDEYIRWIYFGRGEIKAISQEDFDHEVAELSKKLIDLDEERKRLEGGGPTTEQKQDDQGPSRLKESDRMVEKALEDFGGDLGRVLDGLSATLVYETLNDLFAAFPTVNEKYKIVRLLNRFKIPLPSGFRDILINVDLEDGFIGEVRLNIKPIADLYRFHEDAIARLHETVEPALLEQRRLTAEESRRVFGLWRELKEAYDKAFAPFAEGS